MSGTASDDKAALLWLNRFASAAGRWQRLVVIAALVQTLALIAQSGVLAHVLAESIVAGAGLDAVGAYLLAFPALVLLRVLAGWLREEAGMRVSLAARERLRSDVLDRLHALGGAWLQGQQSGALAATVVEAIEGVDGYFARWRPQRLLAGLVPLCIALAVLPVSWAAALILLLTAPLIPVFMAIVGYAARARQVEQLQALARMSGRFLDTLRGLTTLRLIGAQDDEAQRVASTADQFRRRTMAVLRVAFLSGTVLEFFASVAIALVAVYLGFSLLGYLDFGFWGDSASLFVALFVLLLAPEFYLPLRELGTHYHARAEALAAVAALQPIMTLQKGEQRGAPSKPAQDRLESIESQLVALAPQPPQPPAIVLPEASIRSASAAARAGIERPEQGLAQLGDKAPALVLSGLVQHYDAAVPVLAGVSLTVPAGARVAVIGESGAGKTTLLRLLLGEVQPDQGEILVDGVSLNALDLQAWRERIGWMGQHPRLLAASVADNLRVAKQSAPDEALHEALRFAGLDDWFADLPDGLETRLGEGARRLSGGQLRRLALARLYLRDAPLWLLDEPTASLDLATEALLIERLSHLSAGRSVILLTHREAALGLVEQVFRLQGGQLVQVFDKDTFARVRQASSGCVDIESTQDSVVSAACMSSSGPPEVATATPSAFRSPAPSPIVDRPVSAWAALVPFIRLARAETAWMLAGALLTLLTLIAGMALLGLSGGFLAATAVAGLAPATALAFNFFPPASAIRFLAISRTAGRWGERVVTHEATFRLLAALRNWLYIRLVRLAPTQLARVHSGDLLGRLTRDIDALDNLYLRFCVPWLAVTLVMAMMTLVLGWVMPVLVWLITVLMVTGVLVVPALAWFAGRRLAPRQIAVRADLRTRVLDAIDAHGDFALHAPAWLKQRTKVLETARDWMRSGARLQRRAAGLRALLGLAVGVVITFSLWWLLDESARLGMDGHGYWLAVAAVLLLGSAELLQGLVQASVDLPGTVAAAQRLRSLTEQRPALRFAEDAGVEAARAVLPAHPVLCAAAVCFQHDPAVPVVHNLNLTLRAGEHVALLGPSGGGKSSLVALLAGLEAPSAGTVTLGGRVLTDYSESELRRLVACVTQEPWLFTATLGDNLRMAAPAAEDARLLQVLEIVGLSETLRRWPEGLETWLEEGGASLSGGQRRRVAIARALLRETPILILDEPTEGLDSESEHALIASLRTHCAGRTLLWVTHRAAGVRAFDRVLQLTQGRIEAL